MAAPPYKSSTTHTAVSGTAQSLVLPNTGDGAATGDFAILVLAVNSSTVTSGDPSGWTPITGSPTTATSSGGKFYVWIKAVYAAGDLGATMSWTLAASSRAAMACITTAAATLVTTAKDETNTAGTSVTAPSVTPSTSTDLLICVHGVIGNVSGAPITWTPDAATTKRVGISSANGTLRDSTLLVATQELTSSSATGTRIATPSASVQRQGISLILTAASMSTPFDPIYLTSQYGAFH